MVDNLLMSPFKRVFNNKASSLVSAFDPENIQDKKPNTL